MATDEGCDVTRDEESLHAATDAYREIVAAQPDLPPSQVAYLIERRGIDADAARLVVSAAASSQT